MDTESSRPNHDLVLLLAVVAVQELDRAVGQVHSADEHRVGARLAAVHRLLLHHDALRAGQSVVYAEA